MKKCIVRIYLRDLGVGIYDVLLYALIFSGFAFICGVSSTSSRNSVLYTR